MRQESGTSRLSTLLIGLSGWLYLVAGVGLLSCVAVIPAHDELERAQKIQQKAEREVEHRHEMRSEAGDRLAALAAPSEALLVSLAQTHLNLSPAGSRPIALRNQSVGASVVTVAANALPAAEPRRSMLERIVTTRPWRSIVIVIGAVCVLVGLLPPAE